MRWRSGAVQRQYHYSPGQIVRSVVKRLGVCLAVVTASFVAVDLVALHSITQALGVSGDEPVATALMPKNVLGEIERVGSIPDMALPAQSQQPPTRLASAMPAPALPLPQINPVPILASLPQPEEPMIAEPQPSLSAPLPAVVPLPVARPVEEERLPSPAERLGLQGAERARAEKCLANAIYFESRSEPVRGQMAVAQVVLNRVFSPFYPKDVCSVVYQNAHRRLACQFTFACDGKRKVINERANWARAVRIAKQTLDGKLWLPEVAKSTHYHATYVHPSWRHEMKRLVKYGVHLFYRPYNWGDGSDEPAWGPKKPVTADSTGKAGAAGKTATAR